MPGIRPSDLVSWQKQTGKGVDPAMQAQAVNYNFTAYIQAKKDGLNVTPEQFGLGASLAGKGTYSKLNASQQFISDFYNNKGDARQKVADTTRNPYGMVATEASNAKADNILNFKPLADQDIINQQYKPVHIGGETDYSEIVAERNWAQMKGEPIPTVDGGHIGDYREQDNPGTPPPPRNAELTPATGDTDATIGPNLDPNNPPGVTPEPKPEPEPQLSSWVSFADDDNIYGDLDGSPYITSTFLEPDLNMQATTLQTMEGSNAIFRTIQNISQNQQSRIEYLNFFQGSERYFNDAGGVPSTTTYSATLGGTVNRQADGTSTITGVCSCQT